MRIKSRTAPPDLKAMEDKLRAVTARKRLPSKRRTSSARHRCATRRKSSAKRSKAKAEWQSKHDDKNLVVTEDDIAEIVTAWTGIPVKKLAQEESERLLNLDQILKERVINQDKRSAPSHVP